MSPKKLILLVCISLLIRIFSADEFPRIDLFRGYGINPGINNPRALETGLVQSSFMYKTASVQVGLGELFSRKINYIGNNNLYMTITISSSETGFFIEDDYFGLNCDPSYCKLDNSTTLHRSPWTIGYAGRIFLETPISVANGAWKLQTSALYYSDILSKVTAPGVHPVGWIGLGTSSEARKNFQTEDPVFSIAYDAESDTGNLIFGFNSSLADISKPVTTLPTNANWEMELVSVSAGDESIELGNYSKPAVFDLMNRDIAFPKEIASLIISQFEKQGLECVSNSCTSPTLEGLPPLIFTLSDNTQFSISPQVYMKTHEYNGTILYNTMNIVRSRLAEYSLNYIIFGKSILAHYYAVFQQKNQINTITLYSPASNTTTSEQLASSSSAPEQIEKPVSEVSSAPDSSLDMIVIIILIFIFVLLVFVFIKKIPFQIKKLVQYRTVQVELTESDLDRISIQS